jgi:DNA-binding MarR family transcriptional regulator
MSSDPADHAEVRGAPAAQPSGPSGGAAAPASCVDETTGRPLVDLTDPVESDNAYRVALAWRELRRGASTSAIRAYFYGTGDDALDPGQMDTLDALMTRRSWRMSELAEALRVDPSTATRAVQRLVKDDLAERRPSESDGRVVLVVPSRTGRRRHTTVAKRRVRAMRAMLAEFDADERVQLAELMSRFVAALDHFAAGLDADHEDS